MTALLDDTPRLSSLPAPSRLVRISASTWQWLRESLGGAAATAPSAPQREELARAGILRADDASALLGAEPSGTALPALETNWEQALRAGLASPVGIELVCVDGTDGWTSSLRVAGRLLLITDQRHGVASDGDRIRLEDPEGAVLLGIATIDHLDEILEALVPQRPAFTDAAPRPAPADLADAPAVAEVQALVVSSPTPESTVAGGGSFYALGETGEHLAVVEKTDDGATARQLAPRSLSSILRLDVINAINHAAAARHPDARGKEAS